ncbi:uncharacterized protein LOC108912341 [Anoplophora glabripennis]|uniref:uncharacterized protein LOC108912341 n=1 Tax=Anoplophora glabripennis TaxID=217634 RepID=UPI000874E369|nr:uncharacterized protein LOC108912341 [Anoplophora glabripennis]
MMQEVIIHQEIGEFLCLKDSFGETFFTKERTLQLIDLYRRYKLLVGTGEIKTMKKLWEVIAKDISNLYKVTVSAAKCENRWKCLERSYKKVIDNNRQTGRGLKVFEFEKEFDTIYGKKCNIRPEILIDSDQVINTYGGSKENGNCASAVDGNFIQKKANAEQDIEQENKEKENILDTGIKKPTSQVMKRKRSYRTETHTYKKRNEILIDMKNDLKTYYTNKIENDKKKLALQEKKLDDQIMRTALLREYVDVIKEQGSF